MTALPAKYHRDQAANLRRMAAAEDRFRERDGWRLNADETQVSIDVAADLRRQAMEHEERASG